VDEIIDVDVDGNKKGCHAVTPPPKSKKQLTKKCRTAWVSDKEEEEERYWSEGVEEIIEVDTDVKEKGRHTLKPLTENKAADKTKLGV
jgi:hypothetical protein